MLDALNGTAPKTLPALSEEYVNDARAGVDELMPRLKSLTSQKEKLEAELASLPRFETTLRKLLPILPPSVREPENRSVGILVSREHMDILDLIGKRVHELTQGQADAVATDVDSSTRAMLIVFNEKFTGEIESLLGREDISRLRLPAELGEGSPDVVLAALYRRMKVIPDQIAGINREIAALSEQWSGKLFAWRAALQEEIDASSILPKFGETHSTFVLAGWVPADQFEAVEAALRGISDGASVFLQKVTDDARVEETRAGDFTEPFGGVAVREARQHACPAALRSHRPLAAVGVLPADVLRHDPRRWRVWDSRASHQSRLVAPFQRRRDARYLCSCWQ